MENVEIKDELREKLKNIFEDKRYFNDIKLIESLSAEFAKEGLPRDIPNKLFMELTTISELTEVELIWLVQKFYDYKVDGKKVFPELKPQNFFSDMKIINAKEFVKDDEYAKKMIFHNVVPTKGHLGFYCFVPATDIAFYKKSELFSYEFDTQRPGKMRKIGTKDTVVKDIWLNPESVQLIGELLYDNQYISDTITMNIPILDGNEPLVEYDKNTLTLTITPNYDTTGNHITTCNITDGWHRINACEYAVNKKIENGENPDDITDGFLFLITLMTPEQARKHFSRINTYNPIDKKYIETFKTNDEAKFINALINYKDEKNIFNNNVVRTFEEAKAFNKLTYYKVLEDAINQTNIDVTNILAEMHDLPKIVKFITKFIDYVGEVHFKNSIYAYNDIKKETNLLDMNMFIGYFVIADKIPSEDRINKYIVLLDEKLNNDNVKKELKEMGLNNKIYSAKKIADYFNNLL